MAVTFLDALDILAERFGIDRMDDLNGNAAFHLAGASYLVLREAGFDVFLAKCLDPERSLKVAKIAEACLRANAQGARTGAARIALDPDLGLVLIEKVPISRIDEDRFLARASAFLAYAEYWEQKGLTALIEGQASSFQPDFHVIRL